MQRGILYLIATPIGNMRDMSFRAIDIMKTVDVIAAEDTRHSRKLLQHYQIDTKMISMHAHNEGQRVAQLMTRLQEGQSIAVISEAGTPLISDPGFPLVRAAREGGVQVVPIPGACAAIVALCASGLPADKFVFEGFLAAKSSARQKRLVELQTEPRTIVFYESPHRILAMLEDVMTVMGAGRRVVIGRELTKQYETLHEDTVEDLLAWMTEDPQQQRGEFVVMVAGAVVDTDALQQDSLRMLKLLLTELPLKQAVRLCAELSGAKKNELYQTALQWQS
ncbi:MAG: 16S rRNA (cytidine(1402)-2'-O)-methyltransferase [Pseudomonadota bacterium]|nr:16S rRNA (cytidine(1402)-2'-O)-methyltransferase [Pseudomonadota bacterium]